MFGTKLRTWMEAHIVRPKKKKDRKKGEKGFDSNCNSPGSHHSTNRSPALHQVHPVNSPVKNADSILLSNGSSAYASSSSAAGSATTTNSSSGASGGTGSVNLSSPESAYSTGYSTDGTSPGASYPPEYYINIRTGTHYFQNNKATRAKRPGEGAPVVAVASGHEIPTHEDISRINGNTMTRESKLIKDLRTSIPLKQGTEVAINHVAKQPPSQLNSQTHQRESPQQQQLLQQHRRAESYSMSDGATRNSLAVPSSIPPPLVSSSAVQSPRQRSRIRTNPWLSANSSGSSTAGGYKSRLTLDESSSSSGLKLTESSGSASDVNVNNLRNQVAKRECRQESLSAGRSPINQNWRVSPGLDARSKMSSLRRSSSSSSNSSSSVSSLTQSIRSSEDDITLNEMMGKFDESYIYEKETDILSDSDPTDCEDYVNHSPSDVDTGQDGGDENDPFENDDFDYIDNGSFLDLDNLETHLPNTGHCTYFAFTSELSRRSSRLRESFLRRRSKEEAQHRSTSVRSNVKRQTSVRHKKLEEKPSEKRKKRQSQRKKVGLGKVDDMTANLNRVLVERMLLKNSGFNQGSRSVGGTPICLRRRKHHDVNENLSPLMQNGDHRSFIVNASVMENEMVKRRSNSVSYVNGNVVRQRISGNSYMTTFASEIALMEADKEADRKYRELILEAENILVNMKNASSPVIPSPLRRVHNGLANKRVELIKNTELNIELALLKSRNSQPELQSGSIRDLEHTSPKRQFNQPCSPIHRFIERNTGYNFKDTNCLYQRQDVNKPPESPVMQRTPQNSPRHSLVQNRMLMLDQETKDRSRSRVIETNGTRSFSQDGRREAVLTREQSFPPAAQKSSNLMMMDKKEADRRSKEETPTSSSSDSEDRCEVRQRAPLMTFRSVDMGPIRESTYYCPQSEPVKRKVYAGSATYGRIQKSLGERHVVLRNSDGDTATDDTDDSKRSLREKVAQLRQERLTAEANLSAQDTQLQQHLTQLRRQMLMHTIEGLKRSLEDQSATLKQKCLQDSILDDELP